MSRKTLTYVALCIALSIILSNVRLFRMPQGGTVSACSMLFLALAGYWFGPAAGIAAGVACGFLQLFIDPYVVHPLQMLLDYPLAYGALGLSGFFRGRKHGLYTGYIVGCLGRGFFSFLSGIIFFQEYVPEGKNLLLYSLGYNFTYIFAEMALTMVIVSVPAFHQAIMGIREQAA